MSVVFVTLRHDAVQNLFHLERRLAGRQPGAVGHTKRMRVDADGGLTEGDIEHNIRGLAANARQGFELVKRPWYFAAMRHVSAVEAKRLRKANKTTVLACGLIIAVLASVPFLNLVTPLFATGFMVRMYKRIVAKSGGSLRFAG